MGRFVYFLTGAAIGLVTPFLLKLARESYKEFVASEAPIDDDDEDSIKIHVQREGPLAAEASSETEEPTLEPSN
ncbi:MAG: hypothetical protein LBE38_00085 [Deltaproteobacteria bacterium]|jgi:hypothetical protein|nr:hypothetical protein [Deltaproteobacteria bacterium]